MARSEKCIRLLRNKTGNRYAIKKITHLEFGTVELTREISILKQMKWQNVLFVKEVIPVFNISSEDKK